MTLTFITLGIVSGQSPAQFEATGGTIYESGGFKYHKFTSSSVFEVVSGESEIEYLIIGGGGNGKRVVANNTVPLLEEGGGGAGELSEGTATVARGSFSVAIGGGGSSTTFASIATAIAGGASGEDGASGGGYLATSDSGSRPTPNGTGIPGIGNDGEADPFPNTPDAGGGGGGAGEAGGTDVSGYGGDGIQPTGSFWASVTGAGADGGYFVAGGGGGRDGTTFLANGGTGGGGDGAYVFQNTQVNATNPAANTGSGGGGGASDSRFTLRRIGEPSNGASGLLIIRYAVS